MYFEEQGIHSNQPGAEFYITIYGSIAQSESENISANIKWGKAQAAREGKVVFRYKNFLGYDRTARLRRMQNTIPPMHLDGRRQKENRMAMYKSS